jgi:hypothetical protein
MQDINQIVSGPSERGATRNRPERLPHAGKLSLPQAFGEIFRDAYATSSNSVAREALFANIRSKTIWSGQEQTIHRNLCAGHDSNSQQPNSAGMRYDREKREN